MKAVRTVVSVAAIVLAIGASARTFEVAAWRGETVAARVPDFAELAHGEYVLLSAKDGIEGAPAFNPESTSAKRWHLETETAPDGSATVSLNWRRGFSLQIR